MKDFIKWLGVNEKIAKLVVWLLIIMVMLIIFNTALYSIGFPHYQITYENLNKINWNNIFDIIANWFFIILSFYAIVLLVFRTKEAKNILKYAIIYLIVDIAVSNFFSKGPIEFLTIVFMIIFSYLYSNRNYKYVFYIIASLIFNSLIQGLTYFYKAKLIDYKSLSDISKGLLFVDYFIIMGIIILVKEIYLNKRSEKIWIGKEEAGCGSETSKKKVKSQKKSQKN